MIRLARREARAARSSARFEPAAIESLSFADHTFDVALLSVVIHCLPSGLKATGLRETSRILKPGGRLIVVDLGRPRNPILRALPSPFRASPFFGDHLRGLGPDLLQRAGFAPIAALGRWRSLVGIWVARKPAKDVT